MVRISWLADRLRAGPQPLEENLELPADGFVVGAPV